MTMHQFLFQLPTGETMNTQPGTQLVFPWMNGYTVQNALQSIKQVPDPLPDFEAVEPHPEAIGLRVISCERVKK